MCNIIWSPAFPGYFPAILAAVRSNIFAPVSVQTQCTSIFFPTPRGPAIRTDLTSGDFSCTAWDPARQITEKDRNFKIQPISQPIIFASDQELALKGKVCPGTISCEAARRLKLTQSFIWNGLQVKGTKKQTETFCRYRCHKKNRRNRTIQFSWSLIVWWYCFFCCTLFVPRYLQQEPREKKREHFLPSSHMDFRVLSRLNDDRTFYSFRYAWLICSWNHI